MASNGWRHARQKKSERHWVGPNALSSTTRPSPQYGQRTSAGSDGGAIPATASAARPAAVIRSLVHGTAKVATASTA